LLNVLIGRGFGWLAAEIIDAIERGEDRAEEKDYGVSEQRLQLEQSISERGFEKTEFDSSPDYSGFSRPILGDEQVRTAVHLLTLRLSDAVLMLKKSSENFQEIFGVNVRIQYLTSDLMATLDVEASSSAGNRLRGIEQDFVQWLNSHPSDGET